MEVAALSSSESSLPSSSVLSHVVDVHCHPTDTSPISSRSMDSLKITICAMATRSSDQSQVRQLAEKYSNVIPAFGYHPWFSHLITLHTGVTREQHYRKLFLSSSSDTSDELDELLPLLPDPVLLDDVLSELRLNLGAFPIAMLGEVGIDRSFRIPFDPSASPLRLTKFNVPLQHQFSILEAQLDVAVELRRNVSLHSVKAQMITVDLLARMSKKHGDGWSKINIDMHSCGFSPQVWKDLEKKHPNIFLSLSTVINGRSPNHRSLIETCSPSRILVESDFHDIDHCTDLTWTMVKTVASVKGWHVEQEWDDQVEEARWGAVRRLEENWKLFQRGGHHGALKP